MKCQETTPGRTEPSAIRMKRHHGGWAAEGPGFYVWDEDPQEVIRAVRELRLGNHGVRPTHRMLIVHPGAGDAPLAGASAEALDL